MFQYLGLRKSWDELLELSIMKSTEVFIFFEKLDLNISEEMAVVKSTFYETEELDFIKFVRVLMKDIFSFLFIDRLQTKFLLDSLKGIL